MIYSLTVVFDGEKNYLIQIKPGCYGRGWETITGLDSKESRCKYLPHEHNSSGKGYFPAWMEEKMSRQIYFGAAIK